MADYLVVDAHVHTYKTPEIGLQAMGGAGQAGCNGTPEELLDILREAGIAKVVQVNMTPMREMYHAAVEKLPENQRKGEHPEIIATMSERVKRRNRWTCELAREHPELIAFPSIDPLMGSEAMVAEVEACAKDGAKGIKLHPAEGHYFPRDERLWPVYAKVQKLGLPIISHGGVFMMTDYEGGASYTRPSNFEPVLESFPKLKLVVAHLGHGYWNESVELAKKYPNVFFDTSAVISGVEHLQTLSASDAVSLIRTLGVERVMFGSDYPWFSPASSLKSFLQLSLTTDEKEKILGKNARRILKI
ncbi:MAG: amidohydrolase [Candidatus Abyssobacteria bacterium SURF_17]|uniref:Amidohydrolase n=1 Tax=Candidatus Abyssobacteria bacterium SURF_17 TaxID=2093361 RepID=A0A419F2Z2_9BACT|nr:MAG: amidohydrolase [Candidatus Abyssubacteria bacterium SURF_17]